MPTTIKHFLEVRKCNYLVKNTEFITIKQREDILIKIPFETNSYRFFDYKGTNDSVLEESKKENISGWFYPKKGSKIFSTSEEYCQLTTDEKAIKEFEHQINNGIIVGVILTAWNNLFPLYPEDIVV